ncbi:MAG: hypothetical protein J0H91_05345, partial [Rhodospirillales bacterium]|nr:hypothetical protein [Rhodospirillales bacterium]
DRGGTEAGRAAQREALRQAAGAAPDPGWHCRHCGASQPAWQPACAACHTAGSVTWGQPGLPPRPALIAG